MPTVYAAGNPDANGYLQGLAVNTKSALITNLRDILVQAGWTVNSTNIATFQISAEGDDSGNKCYINWAVVDVIGNEKKLTARGDFTGNGSSLGRTFEIPFYENSNSKLYVSTDLGGGVVCILNTIITKSIHFGFPNRLHTNPGSWFVGLLDQWLDSAQIAEDPAGNRWQDIHKYFTNTTESKITPIGAYQFMWDLMTIAVTGSATNNHADTGSVGNIYHEPWSGTVDRITGKPLLSHYGYLIGQLPFSSYVAPGEDTPAQKAVPMHNPGFIRFARTGVASLAPGEQYQNSDGSVVMSAGAAGEYQGFLIKAA